MSATALCIVGFVSVWALMCVFEDHILCGLSMGHLCVCACLCEATAVLWSIRMLDMSFGVAQDGGHH